MTCPLCEDFYRRYPLEKDDDGEMVHVLEPHITSSPIQCAFPDGVFVSENWCCETMGKLRELAKKNTYFSNDSNLGIIIIPCKYGEINEGVQRDFLTMLWYKSRGRTNRAWVMDEDSGPLSLTLKTAQFILANQEKQPVTEAGECVKRVSDSGH